MPLPAGWYPVTGDPAGTQRYWDGDAFTTGPKRNPDARQRAGFAKPNSAAKWRQATLLSRVAAAIIDYGAPVVIVVGIANALGVAVPDSSVAGWTAEPRMMGAIIGCWLVNQIALVGVFGVSLGRILLGLRVVDARDKDRSPGLVRAAMRLALLGPALPVSALMFILGRRQGFHDLVTGTAVIYA